MVAIVTGVAAGPGAMALTIADSVYMLEHALLDCWTRSPGPSRIGFLTAQSGFWGARECLRLGIVDGVIPEPFPATLDRS
ncbi:MAG: hypothetical protein R2855_14040 [Thermomicrobiales bacterium]